MKITARFIPQVWVDDYAVQVDNEGEPEWDATNAFIELPESYRTRLLEEIQLRGSALDDSDYLKEDPNAPAWVRAHGGPFDIYIREAAENEAGAPEKGAA